MFCAKIFEIGKQFHFRQNFIFKPMKNKVFLMIWLAKDDTIAESIPPERKHIITSDFNLILNRIISSSFNLQ